jgi:hypothetical protein
MKYLDCIFNASHRLAFANSGCTKNSDKYRLKGFFTVKIQNEE